MYSHKSTTFSPSHHFFHSYMWKSQFTIEQSFLLLPYAIAIDDGFAHRTILHWRLLHFFKESQNWPRWSWVITRLVYFLWRFLQSKVNRSISIQWISQLPFKLNCSSSSTCSGHVLINFFGCTHNGQTYIYLDKRKTLEC